MDANSVLDEITARPGEVAAALANLEKVGGIAKIRYTHDAMIDLIIADPSVSQNALAAHFGYTPGWVSQIINSDMFQAKLALRRDELVNPALRLTIEERFRAMTVRSLEVLQEKLSKDPAGIPDNLALRAAELGAKALGVGGNAPPAPPPGDHLGALADRLIALQSRARTGAIREQIENSEVILDVEPRSPGHQGGSGGGQSAQTHSPGGQASHPDAP